MDDDPLVLARDLRDPADTRQQHARAALAGEEVRVRRGVYTDRDVWLSLNDREQYLLRLQAFARTRKHVPTFSHLSAAILHDLPLLKPISSSIHVAGLSAGARSRRDVIVHSVRIDLSDIIESEGFCCTSVMRTVVDLAATVSTEDAVVIADHVLRRGSNDEEIRASMSAAWERAQPQRSHRRALEVIRFADGRAESPLESLSRLTMRAIGIPRPELQASFADSHGQIGRVDFWWPQFGVVGEADGDAKYLDPALRGGRTADRVVLDEKHREDRLRALGLRVVRWRWSTARKPSALAATLHAAGLPTDRRAPWGD